VGADERDRRHRVPGLSHALGPRITLNPTASLHGAKWDKSQGVTAHMEGSVGRASNWRAPEADSRYARQWGSGFRFREKQKKGTSEQAFKNCAQCC
jgi:hypothetical protein